MQKMQSGLWTCAKNIMYRYKKYAFALHRYVQVSTLMPPLGCAFVQHGQQLLINCCWPNSTRIAPQAMKCCESSGRSKWAILAYLWKTILACWEREMSCSCPSLTAKAMTLHPPHLPGIDATGRGNLYRLSRQNSWSRCKETHQEPCTLPMG